MQLSDGMHDSASGTEGIGDASRLFQLEFAQYFEQPADYKWAIPKKKNKCII